MNTYHVLAIARFVWTEVRRARLWWLALAIVLFASALAEFAASIAVTESSDYRITFYAVSARIAAVVVMTLLVLTGVTREVDDRVVDLVLSRPVSRAAWYGGKLLAYVVIAVVLAAVVGVQLIAQVPMGAVVWSASLAMELCVIAAVALAFAVTIRHAAVAIAAVLAFYLLCRSIGSFVLMSRGPTADLTIVANRFFAQLIDGIAYVLPNLQDFTRTAWLLGSVPGAAEVTSIVVQTALAVALLSAVGLFDLHRRNF